MATISDERLAEILRNDERCVQLHPNISGRGPNPTRMDFEDRAAIARELQSIRSQESRRIEEYQVLIQEMREAIERAQAVLLSEGYYSFSDDLEMTLSKAKSQQEGETE